jgi:tetraacyldisaccharide 4'-kinase
MFLTTASALYGAAARWRRRWYSSDSGRRRHLARPVISVGNLRAGGSGKTPVVERIARLLLAAGERPAILTRGYGRREAPDGVTVVSDGSTILAGFNTAGDEPLMLARMLSGVPVLVSPDRYLAGRLAEERFGATVHLLDDGFQHFALARDVDLLLASEDDLSDRLLPTGQLREPLEAAEAANALLTSAGHDGAERLRRALRVETVFHVNRTIGSPRWITGTGVLPAPGRDQVLAVAGVARPERFFEDLAGAGWKVAGTLAFNDHHVFDRADIDRIAGMLQTVGAAAVLTTEKDAVRFETCDLGRIPLAAVPLHVDIEPEADFRDWLVGLIRRTQRPAPSTQHPAPSTQHPAPSTQHPK